MIRQWQARLNQLNMALDVGLVYLILRLIPGGALPGIGVLSRLLYAAGVWFVLILTGFYDTDRRSTLGWRLVRLLLACIFSGAALGALRLLARRGYSAASVYALVCILSSAALGAKYTLLRLALRYVRKLGWNRKEILLIGTGPLAQQFYRSLQEHPGLGYQVIGCLGDAREGLEAPVLGGLSDLERCLRKTMADEVVIALEPEQAQRIRSVLMLCQKNGLPCSIVPDYQDLLTDQADLVDMGGSRVLIPRQGALDNPGWALLKRALDLVLSAAGLVLLSPLMLFIAIGVKCSSPGPVLLRQQRVGLGRRPFTMLKFRSMRVNDREDSGWSTPSDERRTWFGAWLRKLSLDELPQLVNVLRGEMSLVGPRPELPVFVEQFRNTIPNYMLRHQIRPGMTGWAQINGYRGDTSIELRAQYDLWYIRHWSIWLDLRILLRTLLGGAVNRERLRR